MRKNINKGGIVALLGFFLLFAYVEGISIEPPDDLIPFNNSYPWDLPYHNNPSGVGGVGAADQGFASKELKTHRSISWQADDQKHKSQDHNETEGTEWFLADNSNTGLDHGKNDSTNSVFTAIASQAAICCRS